MPTAMLEHLNRLEELRGPTKREADFLADVKRVKQWQHRRLRYTYHDLSIDHRFAPATTFFFDELYGEKDTVQRDRDLLRMYPTIKRLLEEFIAYLRTSLATTRENETTLAQEFMLMQRFLAVLQVRMGSRLQVRVDLPEDLQAFVLPPMLIQPLVENAIKHGVEPKIEGGEILLKAAQVGDVVAIEVADTGLGFQNSTSNGIGLRNVRERLDKLYDGKATLSIEDNVPSGTKVTIRIAA